MPTTRTVTSPRIERRLAAILATDVAGYSRLMGTDEVGTLNALKESVIVLPFENNSGDPAQDGVAASITGDVTDAIAHDTTVPLVPAATAAAFRGKAIDLRSIGRAHDVHFALTGNARRQDGRLIVAATLYETVDVRHLAEQRLGGIASPPVLLQRHVGHDRRATA